MRGRALGSVVSFNHNEPGGSVCVLHDIEAGYPWLFHALASIGQRGTAKGLDQVGLDVDMDQYDVESVGHGQRIARYRGTGSSSAAS